MAEKTAIDKPRKVNVKKLVLFAIFVAIMAALGATGLGVISIGPVGLTTLHIFVIIGSIVLGVGYGAGLGFVFGLISMLVATFVPFIGSFAFSPFIPAPGKANGSLAALIVAFVPRILVGVVTPLVFKLFKAMLKKHAYLPYGIAAAVGSLTNSLLVVLFIRLFFAGDYAAAIGSTLQLLTGALMLTVVINGLPEAAVAVLLTLAVARVIVSREQRELAAEHQKELAEKNTALEQKNQMLASDVDRLKTENSSLRDVKDQVDAEKQASQQQQLQQQMQIEQQQKAQQQAQEAAEKATDAASELLDSAEKAADDAKADIKDAADSAKVEISDAASDAKSELATDADKLKQRRKKNKD